MAGRTKKTIAGHSKETRKTRAHAARSVRRTADDLMETGERVAATFEHQVDEAATAAQNQIGVTAANTKPIVDAMIRVGQQYMAFVNQFGNGTLQLAGERYRHNLEFAKSLAQCRDLTAAIWLQRNWALQAAEDYMDQTANMARAAASSALQPWQALMPADEAGT